jgi:hypothetical protein
MSSDFHLREISRFDPNTPIAEASTPPSSWYVEPAFLDLERKAVFLTTDREGWGLRRG